MHEGAIIEAAMDIILSKAKENNIKRINRINVSVGALSGALPDALLFAFQCISKDTIAAGAQFQIDHVKATAKCISCDVVFTVNHFNKLCPICGEFCSNIVTGYELSIKSIEGE